MIRTMFYLAMDINFVLNYILIEINHLLASLNTICFFPDQSKLILFHKKLAGFNGGAIKIENRSSQYSQIINAFVNLHDTIDII